MTIQERLRRSHFIMLVVPVLIAGMMLLIGLGVLLALLETIYLPRLGMTLQELHDPGGGEKLEPAFQWLKWVLLLYGAVVFLALLGAAVLGLALGAMVLYGGRRAETWLKEHRMFAAKRLQ